MTLPLNLSGITWLLPKAVWELEAPDTCAAPAATPSPTEPGADSPAAGTSCADETAAAGPRRVFKGYTYEARVNWLFAETPLSRPWQTDPGDEAARRSREARAAARDDAQPSAPTAPASGDDATGAP